MTHLDGGVVRTSSWKNVPPGGDAHLSTDALDDDFPDPLCQPHGRIADEIRVDVVPREAASRAL